MPITHEKSFKGFKLKILLCVLVHVVGIPSEMLPHGANKRYLFLISQPHSCFPHVWTITVTGLKLLSLRARGCVLWCLSQNLGEKMEDSEPVFKFQYNWVHDPETKCHTKLETGNNIFAKEEPLDFVDNAIAATKTVPKRCQSKLEIGNAFCAKEEPFNSVDNAIAAMETVPNQVSDQKDLPLCLYSGNGPRIHRQLGIESGVVNKRCEYCGQVGQLTCFSPTFRNWALRRVTEEELNQKCSRCQEHGHNCLNCDIPITNRLAQSPVPTARKIVHCGLCGEAGHTRRSCFRAV